MGVDSRTPLSAGRRLGVRQLRTDLAGVIQRARVGERTVVTVRGEPVAVVGPLDSGRPEIDLDLLAVAGLIRPPRRRDRPDPPEPAIIPADVRVHDALDRVRGRR